jgi:hypothetical protein
MSSNNRHKIGGSGIEEELGNTISPTKILSGSNNELCQKYCGITELDVSRSRHGISTTFCDLFLSQEDQYFNPIIIIT